MADRADPEAPGQCAHRGVVVDVERRVAECRGQKGFQHQQFGGKQVASTSISSTPVAEMEEALKIPIGIITWDENFSMTGDFLDLTPPKRMTFADLAVKCRITPDP